MQRSYLIVVVLIILIIGLMVYIGYRPALEREVRFGTSGWSGVWLTIYVPKIILEEEFDYTVEISIASIPAIWLSIATGELDMHTSAWMPLHHHLKEKYAETIESLDIIYGDAVQGWFVPKWVSEEYGITSAEHLKNPEAAKLFDVDGDGRGDLLGCDAAWVCAEVNDEKIAGYELDALYEQRYGAEVMMQVAIEGRLGKREPVLFYFYTPHPLFGRYPLDESLVMLEDPKNYWPLNDIYKYGNKDWVSTNPQAAELLRQVKIPLEDISWAMAEIEKRGDDSETLEAIAREWMAGYQSEVTAWIAAAREAEF